MAEINRMHLQSPAGAGRRHGPTGRLCNACGIVRCTCNVYITIDALLQPPRALHRHVCPPLARLGPSQLTLKAKSRSTDCVSQQRTARITPAYSCGAALAAAAPSQPCRLCRWAAMGCGPPSLS